MKQAYIDQRVKPSTLATIEKANEIIAEYEAQGFELTLRQLYYQFVARDFIPNTMREYKKLGDAINTGRLIGEVSWTAIVDRTRNLNRHASWNDPKHFMDSVVPQFAIDMWLDQPKYVEVWIEKDALVGVIENVCTKFNVPYFSCRGYTSQSEMWAAGQRLRRRERDGKETVIIHLGDHDPSGKDMTRDIEERLQMFGCNDNSVERIALNYDQVKKFRPPPNPAKFSDPRAEQYVREFGKQSWELDALDPKTIAELIENRITEHIDWDAWEARGELQAQYTNELEEMAEKL